MSKSLLKRPSEQPVSGSRAPGARPVAKSQDRDLPERKRNTPPDCGTDRITFGLEALKRNGVRITRARRSALELLARSRAPLSVKELHALTEGKSKSHKATIFRALKLFEQIGLTRSVRLPARHGLRLDLHDLLSGMRLPPLSSDSARLKREIKNHETPPSVELQTARAVDTVSFLPILAARREAPRDC